MAKTAGSRQFSLRYGTSLLGLAAFLVFALLHVTAPHFYAALSALPDGITRPQPFLDLRDVLRAAACWRAGVDVYHPSACLTGGVYNYAPLLLRISLFGIGPRDVTAGGIISGLAFLATLSLLPAPATRAEFLARSAACLSPAAFYALELANFDLVMFCLTAFGIWLMVRARWFAALGYAVFAFAGALKFYPAALLALILREHVPVFLILLAVLLGASAMFIANDGNGTVAAIAVLPLSQPFHATFGALDIPLGLRLLHLLPPSGEAHQIRDFYPQASYAAARPIALLWSGALIIAAAAMAWRQAPLCRATLAALRAPQKLFLLGGALVTVFCFCAAQNVYYRAIFLVLTLPGLWAAKRLRMVTVITALLWEAPLRLAARHFHFGLLFWLVRESLWWWILIQFGALLVCFAQAETRRLALEMKKFARAA